MATFLARVTYMVRRANKASPVEGRAIIGAQIARRQHAAQQHGIWRSPKQGVERTTGHLGINSAQRVIGAEFHDHRIGAVPASEGGDQN